MIEIGKKYKKWTVLSETSNRYKDGSILYECKCECGTIQLIKKHHLLNENRSFCCRTCSQRSKDFNSYSNLVSTKIGKWYVIKQADSIRMKDNRIEKYFECICECGNRGIVRAAELKRGASTRCKECGIFCDDCGCTSHGLNIESSTCELLGFCKRCDKFCCFDCNIDPLSSPCYKNKLA